MDQHLEEKSSGSHPNQTEKKNFTKWGSFERLLVKINFNIPIFGVSEGERKQEARREKGQKAYLKEMANNVPSLQRFLYIQVHETHGLSNKINLDYFQDS